MLYKSEHTTPPRRIDRIKWPKPQQFKRIKIPEIDDCHLPTAAYVEGEWEKFKPFLNFAFENNTGLIEVLLKYREDFVNNDCC